MSPKNHEPARDLYFKATAEPVGTPSKRRIPAYGMNDSIRSNEKKVADKLKSSKAAKLEKITKLKKF